ncbi:phosphate ABC transporter permease PstA [Rhizobium sp. XQZ8]|uniref:phosphate ABC transporter permease PstA n=1 Tax=Rhizobium populisoli TaxID=2859785 RepID=UPI001CA47764|nr:phosphate ABC transporter permease PstA [Rhizobium populisoli]MBW6420421.1 phosphate ABC transporter permease PstA [Rhizobium populisoli]
MASSSTSLYRRRQLGSLIALTLCGIATALGLVFLIWIIWTTLLHGLAALSPALITEMTPPPGEDGGGLANAFMGSLLMVFLAVVIGTPIGVLAGTFLSEFSRGKKLGETIRFVNDILLSAPSIIIGLFVYELIVRPTGRFSGFAGGIALAFIFVPVVVRTTDEMLRLVPDVMREAALSLGIPRWKVTVNVLYRSASTGILTGILLAIARISGETAPLLFTALNNQYWSLDMTQPMANIPVVIFQFAMSPYEQWQNLAWAGAFVMTAFVLILSVVSRSFLNRKGGK